MASIKVIIRTLMVVVIFVSAIATFNYYVKDGTNRAMAQVYLTHLFCLCNL